MVVNHINFITQMDFEVNRPKESFPSISTKYDIYFIHDNGGTPFRVAIDELGKRILVYKYDEFGSAFGNDYGNDSGQSNFSKSIEPVILDTSFERVFLGGPLPDVFIVNGNDFEMGNSILIHITGSRYIFVGMYIYEFESLEPIIEYISPIGSNDVPYPFAKSANETFLMIEDAVLDNKLLEEEGRKYPMYTHNPYRLYYNFEGYFFYDNEYLQKKRKINYRIIQKRL